MSKENEKNTNSVITVQSVLDKIKELIFTYEGTVDAKTFFGCYVILGVISKIILRITGGGLLISILMVLFEAYAKSTLIQKRCRDFGNNGTVYLGLYFMSFLIPAAIVATDRNNLSNFMIVLQVIFAAMAIVWIGAFIKLLLNKSVENKDMTLTAPFMKERKYHIAVIVAATVAAIVMNILWLSLAA